MFLLEFPIINHAFCSMIPLTAQAAALAIPNINQLMDN